MKKVRLTESELVKIINRVVSESMEKIDSILDKINKVGFEGLNNTEKEYLKYYSETGKFKKEDDLISYEKKADYSHSFKEIIAGLQFEFVYEITQDMIGDDGENEILHSGELIIGGQDFYGEIYCDEEGTLKYYDFADNEGKDVDLVFEGLENEIIAFLYHVCEDLKGDMTI